jgi:hypothetical protein
MSDSGVFRMNPLQGWQRDAILKAAQVLRDKFGDPPSDAEARAAHDGLLEVLDPARRTVRLQKELSDTRKVPVAETAERRVRERRGRDRRKVNIGPPPGIEERRTADRRQGDRRQGNRRHRK